MEDFGTKAAYDIITDVGKEIGKAVAMPPSKEAGEILTAVLQAIRGVGWPIERFGIYSKYKRLAYEIYKKLELQKPEQIEAPEPYVAVPALMAMSYSIDNDELRNLYANLLAKAMHKDYKEDIHPSFIEIIKQMSPADACIFKQIGEAAVTPIIGLFSSTLSKQYYTCFSNITGYGPYRLYLSFDNLQRLRLISIDYNERYNDFKIWYDKVLAREDLKTEMNRLIAITKDGYEPVLRNGQVVTSGLGGSFYFNCVREIV